MGGVHKTGGVLLWCGKAVGLLGGRASCVTRPSDSFLSERGLYAPHRRPPDSAVVPLACINGLHATVSGIHTEAPGVCRWYHAEGQLQGHVVGQRSRPGDWGGSQCNDKELRTIAVRSLCVGEDDPVMSPLVRRAVGSATHALVVQRWLSVAHRVAATFLGRVPTSARRAGRGQRRAACCSCHNIQRSAGR